MRNEAVNPETLSQAAVGAEVSPEKLEEEKLMKKYGGLKKAGGPNLAQKRLQHGQRKFFDSGDYNMAKAKGNLKLNPMARPSAPSEKLSVIPDSSAQSPTGNAIPTPDTVPPRKCSIIQPMSDKLSPQPLVHHEEEHAPLDQAAVDA